MEWSASVAIAVHHAMDLGTGKVLEANAISAKLVVGQEMANPPQLPHLPR